MRRRWLNVLASVSLFFISMELFAFFANNQTFVRFESSFKGSRAHEIGLAGSPYPGQIEIWHFWVDVRNLPGGRAPPGMKERLSVFWPGFSLRQPRWQSLCGFHVTIHDARGRDLVNGVSVTFPAWCLILPSLIPIVLWIRQRRTLKDPGFPVTPETAPTMASLPNRNHSVPS
jgi:hypothetical protein